MNVIVFALGDNVPERRIAEFRTNSILRLKDNQIVRDRMHVHVRPLIGVEHDPCSQSFDTLTLNIAQLAAAGVKEIRLEIEQ